MISTKMKNKTGLKLLVYFHRISGQSYLFWNFGQPMRMSLKLILLTLNTILLVVTISYSYINVDDARRMAKNKELISSHSTFMPYIMQISVYIYYAILDVYVFALMLFKGKAILVFLYDMDINIDSRIEKNIGIKVIILQIIVTLIVALPSYLSAIMFLGIRIEIFKNFTYLVENIIMTSIFICLLSMVAYFCFVIQQRLADLQKEFTSLTQLPNLFKKLLIIQSYMKKFDQFYNTYLFCSIVFCSCECVSSLTILYFDHGKTIPWPIGAINESLLQIFIFCYLSDRIDKSYMNIIDKFEHLQLEVHENSLGHFNHYIVNRLYSLRDDMCFTALNLYPLNIKTFMSILSLIITFSVILIQTHD